MGISFHVLGAEASTHSHCEHRVSVSKHQACALGLCWLAVCYVYAAMGYDMPGARYQVEPVPNLNSRDSLSPLLDVQTECRLLLLCCVYR